MIDNTIEIFTSVEKLSCLKLQQESLIKAKYLRVKKYVADLLTFYFFTFGVNT